jgi:hypothetical protein
MRKSIIVAVAAVSAVLIQTNPSQSHTSLVGKIQPFECQDTSSTNTAAFVSQSPSLEPLFLRTKVEGDTCGYEGAYVTNIDGTEFEHLSLQIQGTSNDGAFGPYLRVYYNNSASVAQIPISAGRATGELRYYTQRVYTPADFNLAKNTVINSIQIIANPVSPGDGKCAIIQFRVNEILATKKLAVINSCP